jgi:hypothetical protein
MAERKRKVVSKRIHHRECDIKKDDIAHAPPVKMPQVTPEQHRKRIAKNAAEEGDSSSEREE